MRVRRRRDSKGRRRVRDGGLGRGRANVIRRGGGARRRAKGKLSRSFFLSRRGDVERVRILERYGGGRCEEVDVLVVRSRGSRGGTGNRGDVGKGVQGGQERSWASSVLETEGVATRRRGNGTKGVFGRVLEFGGRGATGRKQIIKGGNAWRGNVVDDGEDTSGCGGPWETYFDRGGTSIGVVIRKGGVERIKRIGHLSLRSARIRLS